MKAYALWPGVLAEWRATVSNCKREANMEKLQGFPSLDLSFEKLTAIVLVNVALLVAAIYVSKGNNRKATKSGPPLPPGPRPWPIIGNLGLLGPLVHQDFAKLAKQYGPIMLVRLGSINSIVVSSPQFAELVLKTHDKVFASRARSTAGKVVAYDHQGITISSYGPYWRHVRMVFTLELLTTKRMQQFQRMRTEEVISTLHSILDDCKTGKAARMNIKFGDLTNNMTLRLINNKSYYGPDANASNLEQRTLFKKATKDVLRIFGTFYLGDAIPLLKNFDIQRFKKKMQSCYTTMNKVFEEIIQEHREKLHSQSKHPPAGGTEQEVMDLVDVLLTRPSGVDEAPLTDDQIKAILLDTVVAGTDTSSNTLEWAMAELLRNPLVLKRAQDELDEVVGKDRLVEESDIPRLHYLCAVVKETFRLHPGLPFLIPRETTEDCEVGGYHIPATSRVFVNTWAIGRDPAVWDRVLEFYPERFLTAKMDLTGQDFELLPFGSGRRSCPGRPLGLITIQYMLAVLLHACDWSLPQGLKPENVDLSEAPGLSLPMATPVEAVATARLSLPVVYAHQEN